MKKNMKFAMATLVLSMASAQTFSADFDTSRVVQDIDNVHELTGEELLVAFGGNTADQNVGLVSQVGDKNIAYINQTGAGNFAAIIQNETTALVSNVGYIFQTGNSNRAIITQK